MSTPVIELHHARFGYAERVVVLDANLVIQHGERIAILGPNGCGKSTMVRGLLGLVDHLGGDARLFGTPLAAFRERHRVGYVPQHNALTGAGAATVREIVQTGRLSLHGIFSRTTRADRLAVAEALDLVELGDRADAPVTTLSGGQQRRALIARALAAGPDVLVMDEPTAGVDQAHQSALAEVFERLADRGTTLLLVTHETEPMRSVLQRAIVMDGGRIVADGPFTPGPLATEPAFARVHHHAPAQSPAQLVLNPLELHREREHHHG